MSEENLVFGKKVLMAGGAIALGFILVLGFSLFVSACCLNPTVNIKANASDGPITIDYNTSANLTWTSTNADTCQASGSWSGAKAVSGFESTGNLTSSKTYTITCTNSCGSSSDTVTVNVASQPSLNVSLEALPNSGCSPLNDVDLKATVSGTATGLITYKFDCTNDGTWDHTFVGISDNPKTVVDACDYTSAGSYTAKVYVERGAANPAQATVPITISSCPPPTVDIKANASDGPITIDYNTSANLTWTSTNADTCQASGSWSGAKAVSGFESTGNLISTKTYVITCLNQWGSAQDSVTVNVGTQPVPALSISKSVRDVTQGQSNFLALISTNPSDQIEFRIEVRSTGNTTASNVTVKDILPDKLSYSGNLKIDGVPVVGGNITNGFNLGDLNAGQVKIVTFVADVYSASYFSYGTTSLTNIGEAWADNVSKVQGSATVNVYRDTPPASPLLSIAKLVRNVTDNTSFGNSVFSDPSELIEFKIQITAGGNVAANNVIIKDTLPSNMTYQGNLRIDGVLVSGDIFSGINVGTINQGWTKTLTFEARVASEANFNPGKTTLINTASTRADNVGEVYANASVEVTKPTTGQTLVTVDKKAINQSMGQSVWGDIIDASPVDKIGFKIVISNNGNTTISNLVVKDGLPPKIKWIGNLKLDDIANSGDITSGISIETLSPGQSRTVTFEVFLSDAKDFVFGTTELTNVVLVYNSDLSVTDTAKVKVTRKEVAGEITTTPTGAMDSFIIPLGITFVLSYCLLFGFFLYQRTFAHAGVNLDSEITKAVWRVEKWYSGLRPFDFQARSEKKLQRMISGLKQKEN